MNRFSISQCFMFSSKAFHPTTSTKKQKTKKFYCCNISKRGFRLSVAINAAELIYRCVFLYQVGDSRQPPHSACPGVSGCGGRLSLSVWGSHPERVYG